MSRNELEFLGKITAGMTHEIKNVLAIIKETSGLMEDLVSLCQENSFPYVEKFQRSLTTIRTQIDRGVELTMRLNRFAHSMDEPLALVDLNQFLDQVALLIERFARLKQVRLKVLREAQAPSLKTDRFRLQMAVAACVEACLDHTREGGTIALMPRTTKGGVDIQILIQEESGATPNEAKVDSAFAEALSRIQGLAEDLGAQLAALTATEQKGVVMRFSDGVLRQ